VRDQLRLRERVLRVADLVTSDAVKPARPQALLQSLGFMAQGEQPVRAPGQQPADDGETYLGIRKAFSAAVEELLQQACRKAFSMFLQSLYSVL
jgi:hypothetical protein